MPVFFHRRPVVPTNALPGRWSGSVREPAAKCFAWSRNTILGTGDLDELILMWGDERTEQARLGMTQRPRFVA